MKPTAPRRTAFSVFCHDTLDFIQVPAFPSAIRVFALTHSRRNVAQRYPWLISFSLGGYETCSLFVFPDLNLHRAIRWIRPVFCAIGVCLCWIDFVETRK